jgi:hypothetical protein
MLQRESFRILPFLPRRLESQTFKQSIGNFGCLASWVKRGEFEKTHAVGFIKNSPTPRQKNNIRNYARIMLKHINIQ